MHLDVAKPLSAFGFLTVIEDAEYGFFGGYLIVSDLGRPLEFHCSTPILPSRAQEILYGATLRSYLFGELIGQTLLAKAKLPVLAILADSQDMLSLATLRDEPLLWVSRSDGPSASPIDGEEAPELHLGPYRLTGSSTCTWRPETIEPRFSSLVGAIELTEPFDRIGEAIREAQNIAPTQADSDYGCSSAA